MSEEVDRIRARKLEELQEMAESRQARSNDAPVAVEGAEHFETLVDRHELVLVDFYADWCGPCQMIAPILERLATDLPVTVLKVDTDVHQDLAAAHGVRSLPTLVLMKDGETVERLIGAQDEGRLRQLVERVSS